MLPSLVRTGSGAAIGAAPVPHRSTSASKRRTAGMIGGGSSGAGTASPTPGSGPAPTTVAELPAIGPSAQQSQQPQQPPPQQSAAAKKIDKVYEAYGIAHSSPVRSHSSAKRSSSVTVGRHGSTVHGDSPSRFAAAAVGPDSPSIGSPSVGVGSTALASLPSAPAFARLLSHPQSMVLPMPPPPSSALTGSTAASSPPPEKRAPIFESAPIAALQMVGSAADLRSVSDLGPLMQVRPCPPLPAAPQYEKPMDISLRVEEERIPALPSPADFGPQWQIVLPAPHGFGAGAADESAEAPQDHHVAPFAELGFSLEIDVNDVETLLLLLQSHNPATFRHAASLLSKWLSRSLEHMHALRTLGGLTVLVNQLVSPQPETQLVAAQLLRHCAAVDENKAALLECDSVRALSSLLQAAGEVAKSHAAWCLMLLLCTQAANGPFHRCPSAPSAHITGQLCGWHAAASVHALLSVFPSAPPPVASAVPSEFRSTLSNVLRSYEASVISADLLLQSAFMLGYLSASEGARTLMVQSRAAERLQLVAESDSLPLRRMMAWAMHRIRFGVYSFSFEQSAPPEPVGNVTAYVILLGTTSSALQRFAAAELDSVIRTPNGRHQFLEASGLAGLATALRSEHPPLQSWCLCTAALFTDRPEDRAEMRRCGIIKIAVALLTRSQEVAMNAALLLAALTDNDFASQAEVQECGGLIPLVGLLRHSHPECIRHAAAAIANCAATEDNRLALFHLGALPLLLQHMRHESPAVQVNVLRAIAMSSHDLRCATDLCKIGVMSTMARIANTESVSVQQMTAVIVANCVRTDVARRELLEAGLLKQLLRLLSTPVPALQAVGALAIGNAAACDAQVQREVARLAGLHQLHVLLQSTDSLVLQNVVYCLGVLAVQEDNRRELRRLGAFKRLLQMLPADAEHVPTDDTFLLRYILQAIVAFIENDSQARREAARAGLADRCIMLMSLPDLEVASRAATALACGTVEEEFQRVAIERGAPEAVVLLLARPSEPARLSALRVLTRWSQTRIGADVFFRLGAVPTVISILTTSFSDTALAESILLYVGNSIVQLGDEVRSAVADADCFRAVAQCVSAALDSTVDLACWVALLACENRTLRSAARAAAAWSALDYQVALGRSGILPHAFAALANPNDAVVRAALLLLIRLTRDCPDNVALIRENALLRLLVPLLTHSDSQIQMGAAMVLAQCTETKLDEAVVRHAGALPILVGLLRTGRAPVVLQALCALARATNTDVLSRVEIRRLGVLKTVIALLSSGQDEIQRWAVVLLNNVNEKDAVPTLVDT